MLSRAARSALLGTLVACSGLASTGTGPAAHADQIRDEIWPVLGSLDVPGAWSLTKGQGVTVAVLDSGVHADQADLTGSVITGPDYTAGANPPGVQPKMLHGTNMASIIAGHGHGADGGDGVVGVAPRARVLALRVILENDEPGFSSFNRDERYASAIAQGIRYAADQGADVINLSLGRSAPTPQERRAVVYALGRGAVVVAAAGNEGASARARRGGHARFAYPASFPGVISVAAVDGAGRHAGFSNRNSAVTVSAPGVRVIGAGPGGDYWVSDGTSPATAFVSGIAALIRSRYPKMAPVLVAQAIAAGTVLAPGGGYDAGRGFGRVNATAALTEAGRLTGARGGGLDMPPERRYGTEAGPVRVVRRDRGLITAYGVVGGLALAGLITLGAFLARRAEVEDDYFDEDAFLDD